uniref:DnaJ subfamily C member 28 n=1 Tax=Anthurium amnicola TaxID=1678845 RepID=A0A1D1Z4Z0_9ARAE
MARGLQASRVPALLLRNGLRRPRWASSLADPDFAVSSSSPSSSPSQSKAQQKKPGHRLSSVIDAVNERKFPPELRGRANAVRSETDIANVVEQRIWRSMEEGLFENLPGKGKPLDLNTNPHADPAEDTLYRILSRNGCAPEWIELNKEIRGKITEWRLAMKKACANRLGDQDPKWIGDSEFEVADERYQ